MNKKIFWAMALIAASLAACPRVEAQEQSSDAAPSAAVTALRAQITAKGAKWVADDTPLSRLTAVESMSRLGLTFAPIAAPPLPQPTEAAEAVLPKNLDWRDSHAVSGVRDQGQCGSCWAFAMTQALESSVMISRKSTVDPNLSEQVLLSCSGKGSCEEGGVLNADFLQDTGLPPASYYPYIAQDGNCANAKAGWKDHTYKIGAWNEVEPNLFAIKSALATYGPLPTSFMVTKDFEYYKSGVYSYTSGDPVGGHAVLLVGYNDDGQYFIVKNSWGPSWGEHGFFRIAYSQMKDPVDFASRGTIALTPALAGSAASIAAAPAKKQAPLTAPHAAASGGELSPMAVYKKDAPAVVLIMSADNDGGAGELGTGSVINEAGQILTNAHVVVRNSTKAPYEKIQVYFKPARITGDSKVDLADPVEASIASYDRELDLAVLDLKSKPDRLTVLPLGDSNAAAAGDPVVAIGHPEQGGLWTLTRGIVSTVVANLGGVVGKDVFQTDASINRGNSGGPLINGQGALIGVNTSMARKAADGLTITSVNFSIQSNIVKAWLETGHFPYAEFESKPAAPVAEAEPAAETPAPAAPAPAAKPAAKAPTAVIVTPKAPFKIDDLIEQHMAVMEDLEKEMHGEVEKRRKDLEAPQTQDDR